jgi:hypothetical protein
MVEETIFGSRARSSILGAISFLVAIASLGVAQGDLPFAPAIYGWIGVVFFGALGVPIFASLAYRPHRLILAPQCLTFITTFGQRHEIKWSDVEAFFVWRPSGASMVGYRLHDPSHVGAAPGLGAIRSLGGGWTGGSEQLVDRLNRYRELVLPGP